jgi:NhaP-type Na+/H+ or K+/H+ antiporter
MSTIPLVLATLCVVAYAAHALIPGMSAPPEAKASSTTRRRLWRAAIGLAVGWLSARIHARTSDPQIGIAISLLTGCAAFVPANRDRRVGAAAVNQIEILAAEELTRDDTLERMRGQYEIRKQRLDT